MRISSATRYPHPVLSADTSDYVEGDFSFHMTVSESTVTSEVTVEYSAVLTEPALKKLIASEQAKVGLFIKSGRTYYNVLHPIRLGQGSIEFRKGELRDRVVFRPIIYAQGAIRGFTSDNLHPEFGGREWDFAAADLLAVGPELVINVGLDKLAPMETIFTLIRNDEVPLGQTLVQLDGDCISICASEKTHQGIQLMRQTSAGQLALLNGVYLPAIMEVLSALEGATSEYERHRWFSIFSAKCTHHQIDLDNVQVHADAQKLLHSPLGTLLASKEYSAT